MDMLCEIGIGSYGFRTLAWRILGHSDLHLEVGQDIGQYLSHNGAHPSFEMDIRAE